MLPQKPYLVRAFYEWIIDSRATPYLLVSAAVEGTEVPQDYVEDGEIVLDISSKAITGLNISNHKVEFQATFGGIPKSIVAPMKAILAIYANENGRGMVFNLDDDNNDDDPFPPEDTGDKSGGKGKKGSHLTLVK
jgi:stringent starvation protein B